PFETITLRNFATMPGTIVSAHPTMALGIPGNPNARWAMVPAGLTRDQANALTPASFATTAGQYGLVPRTGGSVLYRPHENYSAQFQLEHDLLGDGRLSMFVEGNLNYQHQFYKYPQDVQITLDA